MLKNLFKKRNRDIDIQKIIENLPIAAFLKDSPNNIHYANPAFFAMFNLKEIDDYSELSQAIYSNFNEEEILQEDKQIFKTGKNHISQREIYNKRKFTVYKTPISERKKEIAVFLKDTEAQANTIEKNKNIIATLTHDLKTPAIAQARAIELLLKGKFGAINESQRSFLNDILNSCNNMLDMLLNMLWLYKFDNKRIAINITSFDINNLIKDIFKENKLIINSKTHNFKFNYKATRIYIKADKMHIKRIITNLIMNAINHSKENTTITIETDLEGSTFIFRVKNEGKNINEEILNCIFDKNKVFTQKNDGISTGLGLYLTNSLLELNGGKMIYNSSNEGINTFGFKMNLSENKRKYDEKQKVQNY